MTRTSRYLARALTFTTILLLLSATVYPRTQQSARRLRIPPRAHSVTVRGFVGGESHDSYVLGARAGQRMLVEISSPRNRANFTVSRTDFGEQVSFGQESRNGQRWVGTLTESGDYFISVVAHPTARYRLKVTIL